MSDEKNDLVISESSDQAPYMVISESSDQSPRMVIPPLPPMTRDMFVDLSPENVTKNRWIYFDDYGVSRDEDKKDM